MFLPHLPHNFEKQGLWFDVAETWTNNGRPFEDDPCPLFEDSYKVERTCPSPPFHSPPPYSRSDSIQQDLDSIQQRFYYWFSKKFWFDSARNFPLFN